jgi:hypothetical protein
MGIMEAKVDMFIVAPRFENIVVFHILVAVERDIQLVPIGH